MLFRLLTATVFMASFASFAETIETMKPKTVVITIDIDKYKKDGTEWDNIPFVSKPAPDVYGTITLPNDRTEDIPLHEDSLHLTTVIENVELKPGDVIHIRLMDRDRGRNDDSIAAGDILYSGERETKENLGKATVKITFWQ